MVGGPHNNMSASISLVGAALFICLTIVLFVSMSYLMGGLLGVAILIAGVAALTIAVLGVKRYLDKLDEAT